MEETSRCGSNGSWTSRRHTTSKPSTGNPVKIETSLKVMDAGSKGKINELKFLYQNLKAVLIKSKSRVILTLVSLMNWVITKDSQCSWKWGDSLFTQVIQSSDALGHDLVGRVIVRSSFPRIISDVDVRGKGKAETEIATSPIA